MGLVLEDKIKTNKDAFIQKVISISSDLTIDPNWLMTVMNSESGLNHMAVNPQGGATGLIQFMPDTAAGLGTTTANLKAMSNVQQLDYVKKYLQNKTYGSYYDLYLHVFYPAAKGKSNSYIIGSEISDARARIIAKQNPSIDLNKDGYISLGEFKKWTDSRIPNSVLEIIKQHKGMTAGIILGLGLLIGGGIYLYKRG